MNYYKRHLGDFSRDTAHLSQGQIGAYDLMLDWYYANEKPLPSDPEDVYRIAKAYTKEERKNADKARTFFDADGRHKRCERELAARKHQAEVNAETGKKGGRPKKQTKSEPKENRIGFDSETESGQENNPSHKPVTSKEQEPKAATTSPEDFRADLWKRWKALPEGGGGSYLAKLFKDFSPEQRVMEAVERTLDSAPAEPKSFVRGLLKAAVKADDDYDALMRSAK